MKDGVNHLVGKSGATACFLDVHDLEISLSVLDYTGCCVQASRYPKAGKEQMAYFTQPIERLMMHTFIDAYIVTAIDGVKV